MTFLPKGYKVPEGSSNYFRFEEGENRFRVLGDLILGTEYWITDPKDKTKRIPQRVEQGVDISVDKLEENPKTGEVDIPKHFWAIVVWNVDAEKIQILEITQKSIQRSITAMSNSKDWGDPVEYDILVTREGKGLETTYTVTPCPKKKLDPGIVQLYKDMQIDVKALFKGEDPFQSTTKRAEPKYD